MNKLILIVVMMGIVTYLPRMLPMALLTNLKLSPYLKSFFIYVPYAVLGALIFPGILSSTSDTFSALVGGTVAVILALLRQNVMVVILGSIIAVYLFSVIY
ncbi:MAG: hypothetical protein PWQ67_1303 [Clostridia bacterium]|jgi:branched-subunit amino acid transport protein|nr:hypothetical protein [Clostridia bacterium]MDN5322849.1 hypothetical protein [Clostridia bacterium]